MATTITRYVNTAGTVGTQDGTTSTAGSSGTAAFATLASAISALKATYGDLVGDDQQLTIQCYGTSTVDASPVSILTADWATDATRYLSIVGNPPHMGLYGGAGQNTAYRLVVASTEPAIDNTVPYTRLTNLSIRSSGDISGANPGVRTTRSMTIERVFFSNASDQATAGLCQGIDANLADGSEVLLVGNCYFYGWFRGSGVSTDAGIDCGTTGLVRIYHCGFVNNNYGIRSPHTGVVVKNCAAGDNFSADYASGTYGTGTTHNASIDNTAPGTVNYRSQNILWNANAATDVHLIVTSDVLIGKGIGVSHDSLYPLADDMDGRERRGKIDLGPDQRSPLMVDDLSTFSFTG